MRRQGRTYWRAGRCSARRESAAGPEAPSRQRRGEARVAKHALCRNSNSIVASMGMFLPRPKPTKKKKRRKWRASCRACRGPCLADRTRQETGEEREHGRGAPKVATMPTVRRNAQRRPMMSTRIPRLPTVSPAEKSVGRGVSGARMQAGRRLGWQRRYAHCRCALRRGRLFKLRRWRARGRDCAACSHVTARDGTHDR